MRTVNYWNASKYRLHDDKLSEISSKYSSVLPALPPRFGFALANRLHLCLGFFSAPSSRVHPGNLFEDHVKIDVFSRVATGMCFGKRRRASRWGLNDRRIGDRSSASASRPKETRLIEINSIARIIIVAYPRIK